MHALARGGLILAVLYLFAFPGRAADLAPTEVRLTRRTDDGAYGTAAYSFRLATQDPTVHRNYVDLVFNVCGQLHINPVTGMSSRIVDLGAVPFDAAGPAPAAPGNTAWYLESFTPKAGHVYLQEIRDERQSFAVEFIVTEASADTVTLRWRPVDPTHQVLPLAPRKGAAGRMGQCGGSHPEG